MLDSVFIQDSIRFPFSMIKSDHQYDNKHQFSTIDFLQETTSGQVQYSTPGGLMTFLHRGMGNRHLPVLWNGTNIQSVINGSYDLSLIPANLYNGLQFYTSGNPALSGNNGLSGTLDIKRKKTHSPLEVITGISSLQNYSLTVRSELNKKKYNGFTGVEYGFDRNIFNYTYDNKSLQRTPTDLKKINIIYQGNYYPNEKQMINIDLWYQNANRNIPVSTTSASLMQHQKDINFRLKTKMVWLLQQSKITSGLTYMNEKLDFTTPVVNSTSDVNIYIINAEIEGIGNKNYFTSVSWRFDQANPNFYTKSKIRNTLQLAYGKQIKRADYSGSFSFRQDLVDEKIMPFSFSLLNQFKKTSLQISRNYNLPGFNDLYWPSGGNESLKTEKSLQAEIKSKSTFKKIQFTTSIYINHVTDWIQWVPQSSGLWTAVNQKKVLSRGFECQLETSIYKRRWVITPEISYVYNKTTALDHYTDKNQIGKQLIYIPQHKWSTKIKFENSVHHFQISYQLAGKRYDTTDHSGMLPVYHLADAGYTYVKEKYRFSLTLNNIFNQHYQIVRYFPMPGIHAEMKCSFSIF